MFEFILFKLKFCSNDKLVEIMMEWVVSLLACYLWSFYFYNDFLFSVTLPTLPTDIRPFMPPVPIH